MEVYVLKSSTWVVKCSIELTKQTKNEYSVLAMMQNLHNYQSFSIRNLFRISWTAEFCSYFFKKIVFSPFFCCLVSRLMQDTLLVKPHKYSLQHKETLIINKCLLWILLTPWINKLKSFYFGKRNKMILFLSDSWSKKQNPLNNGIFSHNKDFSLLLLSVFYRIIERWHFCCYF